MEAFSTTDVYVKNYVKKYLEGKYGKIISLDEKIKDTFLDCLKDKNSCRDSIYGDNYPFKDMITVNLTEHEFYHYGFKMTKTNMAKFSRFVEYEIKQQCRLYAALFKSFGMQYTKGIQIFQKSVHLTENDFSVETAFKDIQRNGIVIDDNMEDKIIEILSIIAKKNIVNIVR